MDSHYIDPSIEDSRQSESRSNNRLSRTASQFQDLNIKSTIASPESGGGTSTEGPATTSTPSFLDPNSHPDSAFTSSPIEEECPPFPRFSPSDINAHWPSATPNRSLTTPLLRLDPAEQLPTDRPSHLLHPSPSRSNSYPVNMRCVNEPYIHLNPYSPHTSTVGVQQYDSRFDSRPTFPWPSEFQQATPPPSHIDQLDFDINDQYLLHQMSPPMGMATLGEEDSKYMPMYSRSASSSPPQGSLTPEQRELKRQRDHARRDTKERMRRERSTSHPYSQSPNASPEMMSKSLSSDYPGGLAPSPLLSQGSQGSPNLSNISNISSPAYLAPYTPQLDGGDMYGGVFPMVPNEFNGPPAYSMPMAYATPGLDPSLQSFMYVLPNTPFLSIY